MSDCQHENATYDGPCGKQQESHQWSCTTCRASFHGRAPIGTESDAEVAHLEKAAAVARALHEATGIASYRSSMERRIARAETLKQLIKARIAREGNAA